jgi:hypothetical protein
MILLVHKLNFNYQGRRNWIDRHLSVAFGVPQDYGIHPIGGQVMCLATGANGQLSIFG